METTSSPRDGLTNNISVKTAFSCVIQPTIIMRENSPNNTATTNIKNNKLKQEQQQKIC